MTTTPQVSVQFVQIDSLTTGTGTTIGIGGLRATHRLSGEVPSGMMAKAIDRYAPPRAHAPALQALRDERVVVLYGARGGGKRTGALNLMADLGKSRPPIMLPDQPVDELLAFQCDDDRAYVIFGWSGEGAGPRAGDAEVAALATKIRSVKGVHLVITREQPLSSLIPHFHWEPPPPEDLLARYGVRPEGADLAELRRHSLPDLVRFAGNLASGMDVATSLAGLDLAHRRDVERWFDEGHDPRDVLEATAAVFLHGLPERVFEPWACRLADAVLPAGIASEPALPAALTPSRKRDEKSLITVVTRAAEEVDPISGQSARCLQFRSGRYRSHVLAALRERYPEDFWQNVYGWLDTLVDEPDPAVRAHVADGVALLAEHDFHGVRAHLLQPWSADQRRTRAKEAVNVLSLMCLNDAMAPLARRTAIRWARSKDELRNCTAAQAFSETVGLRYLSDALWHLWNLSERPAPVGPEATAAIPRLYLGQTANDSADSKIVLRSLVSRLREAGRRNLTQWGHAADIAIAVLGARSGEGLVAARHLCEQPRDAGAFADLWALILINQPRRAVVFDSIHTLLRSVDGAEGTVHDLLTALRAALPAHERRLFATQFTRYAVTRAKGRTPRFVSLVSSILESS
ncbi:hypothetical protein [Nonomuraea gerenzanensis]|uniref:Uncharacterized protein n=1 Tax=Nonomuraea gerenzanensis TaxID=93944 RepID=A0A1M4EMA1_9ACTN|nr:hypothetical protein [Nonomuraea gerenzanensis]UBU11486.1 hypothetical protein LCN96_45410 [Nonomuraea gerenzanensis]SBO99972.1 hypothetical protein BN4615_P9488 [Nonomuraea gerenzanensis]